MGTLKVDNWQGLDRRATAATTDGPTFRVADNISVDTGGQVRTRPAVVKVTDLDPASVGLYARNGRLRAAINRAATPTLGGTELIYDKVDNTGTLSRLEAAETYGSSGLYGAAGYVALRLSNGVIEHHYIRDPTTNTKVTLPFAPSAGLVKLATKMWAVDNTTGGVRCSSSVNGPTDWAAPEDADNILVTQHTSGNSTIVGLTSYRGRLAVLFQDSVQLWQVDPDPARFNLEQALEGPGTLLPQSAVNVLGDAFFLSRGSFRSLSTAAVTGEAQDADFGAPLGDYVEGITGTETCAALWSQTRSQYLCAVGSTVYAFTLSSVKGVKAWTRWLLPIVPEYLVENNGSLYARAANVLYRLDPTVGVDFTGAEVTGDIETDTWSLGAPGVHKQAQWLAVRQSVAARWSLVVDGVERPSRLVGGGDVPARAPLIGTGRQFAFRCRPTGLWRLEGLTFDYKSLGA